MTLPIAGPIHAGGESDCRASGFRGVVYRPTWPLQSPQPHLKNGAIYRPRRPRGAVLRPSGPTRHTTGIERPSCVERLPNHISKIVVSTVSAGGPKLTVGRTIFEMRMAL